MPAKKQPGAKPRQARENKSAKPRVLFWDSCVFLSLLDNERDRAEVIEKVWDEVVEHKDGRIITAASSITEVAFAQYENHKKALDPKIEARIESMWNNPSLIMVNLSPFLMRAARDLIRDAVTKGNSLKPLDAVQLAAAQWALKSYPISEFNTYDKPLKKYSTAIGIPISEPKITKPIQETFETDTEVKK